ncbi:MAG: NosD domain-containing protein [Promethearchaeota archaeon]|jgi:parallel beta-helix repeat protein
MVVISQPLSSKSNSIDSLNQSALGISAPSCDKSDYTVLTGPYINPDNIKNYVVYINDLDPNYNWDKTVTDNSWATGSGTYSDPYIIENLYIHGGGQAGMIGIAWSKKFFIIRNCWFNFSGHGDTGVELYRTNNGTVTNNIITFTYEGIGLAVSKNNTISNNLLISDHTKAPGSRAIEIVSDSHANTIFNNKVLNYEHPLYIGFSVNNTIDRNYAENTLLGSEYGAYPIHVNGVNNTKVINNVLAGAFAYGSFDIQVINSVGNTLKNNTVIVNGTYNFNPCYGIISIETPLLQQDTNANVITLENSHNTLVANNVMIKEAGAENGGAISGYDMFVILGIISIVSIVGVLFKRLKH